MKLNYKRMQEMTSKGSQQNSESTELQKIPKG